MRRKWQHHNWRQVVEDFADSEDADAVAEKHGIRPAYLREKFRAFGIKVPSKQRGPSPRSIRNPKVQLSFLHDLETELIEGRPEIALESIRGAIKIYQKSL